MPRLSIMAVLAYQAVSQNLIGSGLQDNYSLAVAAGQTPTIATASIMTDCTNLGDSNNTFIVDNNVDSKSYLSASNKCIKKYRWDYTNYAAFLGTSPLRVKTASFFAACYTSSCYFKVMVGDDPEPTSALNTQCGPTFTGCTAAAGCYRRANCDLQGKYISLISDGQPISVWDFLTWPFPSLQSSQIISQTSNCGNWFPSSFNIADLSTAPAVDTSVALSCNYCCPDTTTSYLYYQYTVVFNESLTVNEIQFIASNSQLPPVLVQLFTSSGTWVNCWTPNNSYQQYNIRMGCNKTGTQLKVTFQSYTTIFTWKQFSLLLGDSAPSCSVQQTTAQTNAVIATTQSNTATTNADAVASQLTIATDQAAIVATQATAASGFASDSIQNPANANLDSTDAQNAVAIAQTAAAATTSALSEAQTAYNAANAAQIAANAANDANTLLVAQCPGNTVIAASAATSSIQASNALAIGNAAQTNLASTTTQNSQAQVSLNEANASYQVVIAQVAKISAASNASTVQTILQQIIAIQTSTSNNQATASAQATATSNAVAVSDLQAASTSTASTYSASSSCSTSQNNVSSLYAQALTAKNSVITDQTSVSTAIAAITTIKNANPSNTSITNSLSSVSPSAQTAADSSVSQATTDYNSIPTSQTTIQNSCTSAVQSYQTAVTYLITLVTSKATSAVATVTSQTSTVASQVANAATQATLSGTLASQTQTAAAFGELEQAASFSTQAALAATSATQSIQTAQTAYDSALATLQQITALQTTAFAQKTNADNLVAQTSGQSSTAQTSALVSQTSATLAFNSVNTAYTSAILAVQAALIDLNAIKASSVLANNNALNAAASTCSCSRSTLDTKLDPTEINLKVFPDGQSANYTLLKTENSVAKVCGNKDGTFCGPYIMSVLNAKTGAVVTLPNNFLYIQDQTLTLNSKSSADLGTQNYLLRVSLLLYPTVQKQIKLQVTIASDCSQTVLKLKDPTSVQEYSSTLKYHVDQPQKLYITDITDIYSELNKLANACGPFKYQTTIAETGASSVISLIESKTPYILFNTDGDVFEGNFQFSVQVSLQNWLKVKPLEFKFNLILKPCIVKSVTYDPITIQVPYTIADINIPDFKQTQDCGYKPISYEVTGSLQFVTQMPTPSNRVIKIRKKNEGRLLKSAYLTVTPIFVPALLPLIKKVFSLEIRIQFEDQLVNELKDQVANDGSPANQIVDNLPALLQIKKISQSGLVTMSFSKEVIVLKNHTVLLEKNYFGQHQTLHDNLELLVIKDIENQNQYNTTLEIVNMTSLNLTVQMNFTAPLNVSASSIRDQLSVKIWNQTLLLTKGNLMPVELYTTPLNKTIPRQFSGTKIQQMLIEVVEAAGTAGKVGTITTGFLTLVLGIGLSSILGMMKGFVLLCSLTCISLVFPAVLQTVMFTLIKFAAFEVIDTVPIYIETFGTDNSQPLNENFDESGYSSTHFVRNIGSLFLFIWIGIGVGVTGLLILKIKKLPTKIRDTITRQTEKFFFNGVFSFVQQNYMVFSLSALISLTQIITTRESINFANFFSMTILVILVMFPFMLIILTCVRYSNLKNRNSRDFKLWGGGHILGLKMQQELTEADSEVLHAVQEFRLSKIATVVYAYGQYIRYFVTAYVIVFMRDTPAIQILMVHLIQLFVLIFLIFLQPYTSKEQNLTEIVNEIGVLAYILHLRCFTDWVTDTTAKNNVGISLVFVVTLQIVFLLGLLLRNTTLKAKLYGKKQCIRVKHWKAMKQKNELNKKIERLKSAKYQQEQAVFDYINNGGSVLDNDLSVFKAKFAGNKSDLKPVVAVDNKIQQKNTKNPQGVQKEFEIEMGRHRQAELLVDQIEELSFHHRQKADEQQVSSQSRVIASESNSISSKRSSSEDQSDQIDEEFVQNTQLSQKLSRQREEVKSIQTSGAKKGGGTELGKQSDQATVTKNKDSIKKVMPANQDAQGIAKLKQNRKLIVEESKDKKKELNNLKEQIFKKVMASLQEARDPIVRFYTVNKQVIEDSHLLPDDIQQMSLKDQENEVKTIIQVSPEYVNNQRKTEADKRKMTQSQLPPNNSLRQKQRELEDFDEQMAQIEQWVSKSFVKTNVDQNASKEMKIITSKSVSGAIVPEIKKVQAYVNAYGLTRTKKQYYEEFVNRLSQPQRRHR